MDLVIMIIALEVADSLLPICCQDILILTTQTLMDLCSTNRAVSAKVGSDFGKDEGWHTFAQGPVYNSAGANPWDANYGSHENRITFRRHVEVV